LWRRRTRSTPRLKPPTSAQVNRTTNVTTPDGRARRVVQSCDWLACSPPRVFLLINCLISNDATKLCSSSGFIKSTLVSLPA
jgi:hypothetical protein